MFRFSILLLDYFSCALINKCLFFCQYITIVSGHNPLHFSITVDTLKVRVERTMRQYLSTSEDTKSTSVRAINRNLPNLSVKSHFLRAYMFLFCTNIKCMPTVAKYKCSR